MSEQYQWKLREGINILEDDFVNILYSGVDMVTTLTTNLAMAQDTTSELVLFQMKAHAKALKETQALITSLTPKTNNLSVAQQKLNNVNDLATNDYRNPRGRSLYGQRYGLDPGVSQVNGWFTINERLGKMSFSSDLADKFTGNQRVRG